MVENVYPWDLVFKMTNTVEITGVSLRETQPWCGFIALVRVYVCLFAYHKSLPALILCDYVIR